MKNVLVTGGDGFIGKALCLYLVKNGFSVRAQIFDSSNVDFIENAKKEAIEYIETGNLLNYTKWQDLLKDREIVIHLAAKVHEMNKHEQKNINAFREVNVHLTERLAQESIKAKIKRIVFISTIKVNGEKTENGLKFKETDYPAPNDAYGISKLEAEKSLIGFSKKSEMSIVILRLPLVYGEGVRANFLRLIKLVDKGFPIPLKNIDNKRSMIFIGNLVDAIKTCASHEKASNELFLVSDCYDISTKELVNMIAEGLNKKAFITPFPIKIFKFICKLLGKEQEIDRLTGSLSVDTEKIKKLLNWNPPYRVKEGIKETVNWYIKTKAIKSIE